MATKGELDEQDIKRAERDEARRKRLEVSAARLGPDRPPLPPSLTESLRKLMNHLTIGGPCAEFPFVKAEFGETKEEQMKQYKTYINTLITTSYRLAAQDRRRTGMHYALIWRQWFEPLGPDLLHSVPRASDGASSGWRLWKMPKRGENPVKAVPINPPTVAPMAHITITPENDAVQRALREAKAKRSPA